MLEHEQPAGRNQHAGGFEYRVGLLVIRRIEPDDVEQFVGAERRRVELIDGPRDSSANNSIAVLDAAVREILGDERSGAPITLHECH